jgi:O-antigen/teichoic acid export membrane protein
VISAIALVTNISLLGFTVSILRFKDKSLNYTSLIVCSFVSFFISIAFLLGVNIFSPNLDFLTSSWAYVLAFIICTILNVAYALTNPMLIAEERGDIVLAKDTLFSVTKVLLILFLSGFVGLLVAWYVGILLALLLSLICSNIEPKWYELKKVFHFSLYNYASTLLGVLPTLVLPLIVFHYMGASSAAYFYVAWMIAGLLLIVPTSIAQNLLSSGKKRNIKKAYLASLIVVGFGIFCIFLFGKILLSFFSEEYLQALGLLCLLSVSAIPYAIRSIYQTKLNMQGEVKKAMYLNLVVVIITLYGSLYFIQYGFPAIALSWFIGNGISLVGVKYER